jgi:anthranilate phosphoribosyltransferase
MLQLFDGEKSSYRDIVVLNSAFAMQLGSKVKSIDEGVKLAQKLIDDGEVKKILSSLR